MTAHWVVSRVKLHFKKSHEATLQCSWRAQVGMHGLAAATLPAGTPGEEASPGSGGC